MKDIKIDNRVKKLLKSKRHRLLVKIRGFIVKLLFKMYCFSMWLEKRKVPIYWTGENYKQIRFQCWGNTLLVHFARAMKIKSLAAITVVISEEGRLGFAYSPFYLQRNQIKDVFETILKNLHRYKLPGDK